MHLLQPLGVKAKFFGHLDQLFRSFGISYSFGKKPGSVGLLAIVVGLSHGSTFLDEYECRQKGSTTVRQDNGILREASRRNTYPLFVP
jgi:hypothetical protein